MGRIKTVTLAMSLLFCASTAPAQRPTPKPQDDTDVVKISTTLIQVDVTVTDSKGKPITDLRPDEIEIYENGKKQPITNLTYIAGALPPTGTPTPADKGTIPVPQGSTRPEHVRRTFALVVDDL